MTVSSNSSDLRLISDRLRTISRQLHEHTYKLEIALDPPRANWDNKPSIDLLRDSLNVCRSADVELRQISQNLQLTIPPEKEAPSSLATSPVPVSVGGLERDELGTLYDIARALNSSLDLDEVLRMVIDRVIEVVKADRGFLVLRDPETRQLEFKIARDKYARTIDRNEFEFKISRSTVERVISTGEPILTGNAREDIVGSASIVTQGIRSIMCAPLVVRDQCIGAVYVDSLINTTLFGPKHRELMLAFCHQAAIAIDNARLFSKVNEDKQYMDNIFSSIANGVITTDSSGIITTFNDAAGVILHLNPATSVGKPYQEVFKSLSQLGLIELLHRATVQHEHGTMVPDSVDCEIPGRGLVNLNFYVTSLRDTQGTPIGMAVVVDDRTELKRSEAEAKRIRRLFGSYVHPNVVQRLIDDPQALKLGGETKEISVVFADIRGYTQLSENTSSQKVMSLLNEYLNIMVKEIWDEGGTLTAFQGDALMAIFNAPLAQTDHALRAVRAAWGMRRAILQYQRDRLQEFPISYGIGVNTGAAVVGNLGSEGHIQNYTAIGDVVNVASRLQSNASDNNILVTHAAFARVRQYVKVNQYPRLEPKNHSPVDVWLLMGVIGLP